MARPEFEPTDEQRQKVRALAAYGNKQEDIAKVVGLSSPTLRKYFRDELDRGAVEANSVVSQSLYKMAIGGNVAAAIFWLKCRAKWRERPDYQAPANASAPFLVTVEKGEPC